MVGHLANRWRTRHKDEMTVWQKLDEIVDRSGVALGAFFEWASDTMNNIADPALRRQVAFSAALVALSAKMAKADGVVSPIEAEAFRRHFTVPAGEERHVGRLFNLAKADVAGYESYAKRVATFYGDDRAGLEDVLEGLFVIATADGAVHEAEIGYLERVGAIFGFVGAAFDRIAARHVVPEEGDPYVILGVDRVMSAAEIKRRYHGLVAENHPDKLVARGLPEEFITIANERLAAINGAWARIERERRR